MELDGSVVVVTGGASGLGEAMTRRFTNSGAIVTFCDVDPIAIERVAAATSARGVPVDVTSESAIKGLVADVVGRDGHIDLWVSNAGGSMARSLEASDSQWESEWKLNVLSHVYAARAVLPGMLARDSGYLLQVASSVSLAIQPDAIGYSATKRAALAVNEWLALRYRESGVKFSVFCPQGMKTPMLARGLDEGQVASRMSLPEARSTDDALEAVVDGLRAERFLILLQSRPFDEYRAKGVDYDRWLSDRRNEYLQAEATMLAERGGDAVRKGP